MSKKKPKYNKEAAIRGALRRAFSRSPIIQEILAESRREVPRYKKDGSRHKKNAVQRQCQTCNEWVSSSKIAVDHIIPVISVEEGKTDWNSFIERLWCSKDNLARICHSCHDVKTYGEKIKRLIIKYTKELNEIEAAPPSKENIKLLSKYISKKKTPELITISERALKIKLSLQRVLQ